VRSLTSNFDSQSLDLTQFFRELLILMETKSCVRFSGYTMVEALSKDGFFVEPSIILLVEL
jgi:hypothetical protein